MEVLQVKQLSYAFKDICAVKDVSFSVNQNEVVTIIGPSGAGKSTLLRLISRLETSNEGSIYLLGKKVVDNGVYENEEIYQKVGMIFQDFNLFDHLNVMDNIRLALRVVQKKTKEEATARALEVLKIVECEEKINAYPYELSGGQRQRIAIARSLALNPTLLLLDEPTSALDVATIDVLVDTLKRLKNSNISILIVTHDIGFAKKVASRVLIMQESIMTDDMPVAALDILQAENPSLFIKKD